MGLITSDLVSALEAGHPCAKGRFNDLIGGHVKVKRILETDYRGGSVDANDDGWSRMREKVNSKERKSATERDEGEEANADEMAPQAHNG